MSRSARVQRTTKESDVLVELDLDGTGTTDVDTGVPFFDHMLGQLGRHGGFDLTVAHEGRPATSTPTTRSRTRRSRSGRRCERRWATRPGIRRFGDALVPLDEALVQVAVDLSGRPYLVHTEPDIVELIGTYDTTLTRHIFESLVAEAQITPARAGARRAATPTTSWRRSSRRSRGRCATRSASTRAWSGSRAPRAACECSPGPPVQPPVSRLGPPMTASIACSRSPDSSSAACTRSGATANAARRSCWGSSRWLALAAAGGLGCRVSRAAE